MRIYYLLLAISFHFIFVNTYVQAAPGYERLLNPDLDQFTILPINEPIHIQVKPVHGLLRKTESTNLYSDFKELLVADEFEIVSYENSDEIAGNIVYQARMYWDYFPVNVEVFMNKDGSVNGVKTELPEARKLNLPANLGQVMKSYYERGLPVFPKDGVKVGSKLFDGQTYEFFDVGSITSVELKGVVKGIVIEELRPHLLLDLTGTKVRKAGMKTADAMGWMKIDIETGQRADTVLFFEGEFVAPDVGKDHSMLISERVYYPITKENFEKVLVDPSVLEKRIKFLRRLGEKGVISSYEAMADLVLLMKVLEKFSGSK